MTDLTQQRHTWRPNPYLLSVTLLVTLMLAISMLLTDARVAPWFCLGAAVLLTSNGLAAAAICWQIDQNRSRSGSHTATSLYPDTTRTADKEGDDHR